MATIGQFLGLLRRHLLAVVTCLILGLVLAGLLLNLTAKTYQATAVVDVSPIFGTSSSTDSTSSATAVSTVTESQIATSTSVALIARRSLGFQGTPGELSQQVVVTSPLDSRVLNVTFSSSTAAGAADGANAFARAYLAYRTTTVQDALKARVSLIGTRVANFGKAIRALKRTPAGRDASQYTFQRASIESQIQQLQAQMNTYQTSVVKPGQVAGAASAPSTASSPKPPLYVAGGLLLGLLLGLLIAVFRDRRDDIVHDAAAAEDSLGAPVLAEAATTKGTTRRVGILSTLVAPGGAEADAYRTIATTVASQMIGRQVVMLCSATAVSDHPAAMNLAITFATQGLRTVLAGSQASIDPAADSLAVTPVPVDHGSPLSHHVAASARVPNLSLLSLGDEIRLSATLRANGDNLADVLDTADVVVLDGVNIQFPSTLLRLGNLADEAVVVVQKNRTSSTDLEWVAQHLAQVRTTVLGSILLGKPSRRRNRRSSAPVRSRPRTHRPDAIPRGGHRHEATTGSAPADGGATAGGEPAEVAGAFSTASATTRRS